MGLGVIGLGIVSFLAYHWITAPLLTDADITRIAGTVIEAREFSGKNAYLEISVSDQPVPFRCFSKLYPHAFAKDALSRLGPGAAVVLGVAASESSSPRRKWLQNQQFYEFITMKIDGRDALLIDAHNKSVESDRRMAPWFCLVMAVGAIWLIGIGYRHRASNEPITQLLSQKKV
jgi:hypothetical protein